MSEEIYPPFQQGKQYVPVFATCKVPEEYLRTLFDHAKRENFDLMPIVSPTELTHEAMVKDLKEASDRCLIEHVYFPSHTLSDLRNFFIALLRAAPDSPPGSSGFSNFTFAVVDEECLAHDTPVIKICTDAPDETDDFTGLVAPDGTLRASADGDGDGDGWKPRWPVPCLRSMKVNLDRAVGTMRGLEMLVTTFTEFAEEKEMHVSVMPMPILEPTVRKCAEGKWLGLAARWKQRQESQET